ncbi:MAG TPA: alpha/beta hydrolase [Mycobacteriales bacterium]|nr:alpha/beta hydrolase [Mycobacteriales bacterium]
MPLDPEIQALLVAMESLNAPPLSQGTPEAARAGFRFMTVDMRRPEQVIPVKETEDLRIPTSGGDIAARVYRPEHDGPVPTVVFAHGGGFVIGDIETHDNQARAVCRGADAVVVSIDYRLAPEAPWPAAVHDAYDAVQWAADNVDTLGGDSDRLAVAGDSAGGNIAAVVAQLCRDNGPDLCAQLLIYPAVDFDPEASYQSRVDNAQGYFLTADDMEWFSNHYIGSAPDHLDPTMSPLKGSLHGLPPAVVATAEFDPLRDEGNAYADALRSADVEVDAQCYPGMVHGFFDMGVMSKGAQTATDDAIARFRSLLWR